MPENEQTQPLSWNALFLSGSVVSLSTGLWRARAKIKAEDLGITDSAEVQAALSLGSHRLMPGEAFEEILKASREAQRAIDYYSVNFGLIKGARYVPEKNLPPLLEQLRTRGAEFKAAVDNFMTNYEKTKEDMLPTMYQALLDASKSEATAQAAFDRLKAEYPTAGEARGKFRLSWSIYAIRSAKSANAAEFAEQETNEVKSIVADMITQLRADLTAKLQDILAITAKGGKLHEKSLAAANDLLDRVESLNILGDTTLREQIGAMRKVLAGVSDGKYDDGLVSGLNDIQKTLETSVEQAIIDAERNLTGMGRRKLALADEPAPDAPGLTNPAPETASYAEMGL